MRLFKEEIIYDTFCPTPSYFDLSDVLSVYLFLHCCGNRTCKNKEKKTLHYDVVRWKERIFKVLFLLKHHVFHVTN